MIISNINWVSKSAKEAEVKVSDGQHEMILFCYPCDYSENQDTDEHIHPLEITNFQKSDESEVAISKTAGSHYAYKIVGLVDSLEDSIIIVGGLRFEIDMPIPSWAEEGDLIEFESMRFDLW